MRYNKITIGSVVMTADSVDTDLGLYNLLDVQGLDSPVRRISRFQKPSAHGAVIANALYGERVVVISVQIIGTSEADYAAKHQALTSECDLSSSILKTITIEDTSGNEYQITGVIELYQDENSNSKRAFGQSIITVACPDFEISSTDLSVQSIYLQDTSGGVAVPLVALPFSFGASSGGEATIVNDGTVPSYPVIRLYGPLVNPTIFNQETGETMKYNATINLGEWIEIDMKNKTAVNQSGANKLGSLSNTLREFWALQPGSNVIQFYDEGAYNTDAYCLVSWRDTYLSL